MKLCAIGSRGHMGCVFESLAEMPQVKLPGISPGSDDDTEALLQMAANCGRTPKVYGDWRKMLKETKPDLVAIDGPFEEHARMTLFALECGAHVFCEKPIALTLSDLDAVERCWRKSDSRLFSMAAMRYEPPFFSALQAVKNGAVGKVKTIWAQKSYRLGKRPEFYRHAKSYGGTIPWVGIHAMDLIMAFSGSDFYECHATQTACDNRGHGDLEIACQLQFIMKNAVLAQATVDYLRPAGAPTHGDDRVRVAGLDGVLEVQDGKILLTDNNGLRELPQKAPPRKIFPDFIHCIEKNDVGLISEEETFALTRACLALRDKARSI